MKIKRQVNYIVIAAVCFVGGSLTATDASGVVFAGSREQHRVGDTVATFERNSLFKLWSVSADSGFKAGENREIVLKEKQENNSCWSRMTCARAIVTIPSSELIAYYYNNVELPQSEAFKKEVTDVVRQRHFAAIRLQSHGVNIAQAIGYACLAYGSSLLVKAGGYVRWCDGLGNATALLK